MQRKEEATEEGLEAAVGAKVAWDTTLASTRALIQVLTDVAVAMMATREVVGAVSAMEEAVVAKAAMATGATTTTAMGSMLAVVGVTHTEEDMVVAVVGGYGGQHLNPEMAPSNNPTMAGYHAAPVMGMASQPPQQAPMGGAPP
jgi:hypothetical protein